MCRKTWLVYANLDFLKPHIGECLAPTGDAHLGQSCNRLKSRQGNMTEAVRAVVSWALSQPGIYRVWDFCDVENAFRQAGFRRGLMGARMFWSGFDSATNWRTVEETSLRIVRAQEEIAMEFGAPVKILWVIVERPEEQR
jgi:hypothetical protein